MKKKNDKEPKQKIYSKNNTIKKGKRYEELSSSKIDMFRDFVVFMLFRASIARQPAVPSLLRLVRRWLVRIVGIRRSNRGYSPRTR